MVKKFFVGLLLGLIMTAMPVVPGAQEKAANPCSAFPKNEEERKLQEVICIRWERPVKNIMKLESSDEWWKKVVQQKSLTVFAAKSDTAVGVTEFKGMIRRDGFFITYTLDGKRLGW
jgi:hypothetical protein